VFIRTVLTMIAGFGIIVVLFVLQGGLQIGGIGRSRPEPLTLPR
jgi:hypothetical protein